MRSIFKLVKILMLVLCLGFGYLLINDKIHEFLSINHSEYNSQFIYVYERETNSVVFTKNHNEKAYPASLTKIMTTIVALEHIQDLSAIAPVDSRSYLKMVDRNASMAGFYGKETTTYRDLLYATILSSGGEAANSLAVNISKDVTSFVHLMNEKAKAIGLENTHFTSPEGLHNKHQVTTAQDMAKLLDYALENGHFRAIFTKESFQTTSTLDHPNGILLESTVLSKLQHVAMSDFTILGGKSGTTLEAGQCWATLGVKDNKEYIVVVMGSKINNFSDLSDKHIDDTLELYKQINHTSLSK